MHILCSYYYISTINNYHRKNSMEMRDEMYRITDHSFLRFITFGTTKQNLVFFIARRFLNSASSEVNSLIPKLF